jgi:hypothetical protein
MPCSCSRKIPRYINVQTPSAPVGKRFATEEERKKSGRQFITPEEYKKISQKKPSLK